MVLGQHVLLTLSVALISSLLAGLQVTEAKAAPGVVTEESDASSALDRFSDALAKATHPDEKRKILSGIAKIHNRHALDVAISTVADQEVAESARVAADQIASAMMAAEQPRYIRRLAFMRWTRCLTDARASEAVIEALRGDDIVLSGAAMSVIHQCDEGRLVEMAAGQIHSFPISVREDLMKIIISRNDDSSVEALLAMSHHKDKTVAVTAIRVLGKQGGEKVLARLDGALGEAEADIRTAALRGIAEVGALGKPDDATQALLLKGLTLVTGNQKLQSEDVVAAAVQIAQSLAASRPDEVRQALDALKKRPLSDSMRGRVEGALLLFTIDQLPNLAKGATASSPDGLDSEGGSSGDAAAIDGDLKTYWDEVDGQTVYRLRVDFARPTDVSAISLAGWNHHSFSPKDFSVVCDGKTIKTVTGATYAGNRLIVPLPRTSCESLELEITGYYGHSPAIRELGIFDVR